MSNEVLAGLRIRQEDRNLIVNSLSYRVVLISLFTPTSASKIALIGAQIPAEELGQSGASSSA